MRKRSTQEIIEATVTSSTTRQQRINQARREKAVQQQRSADENKKPDLNTAKIRDLEARTDLSKARREALVAAEKRKEDQAARDKRSAEDEGAAARISKAEKRAKDIKGDGTFTKNLKKTQGGNKSISDTGTVATNLIKRGTGLARGLASIPDRMKARKEKETYGKVQIARGEAPTGGTKSQRIGFATKPARQRINTAVANTRRKVGRGIEKTGGGVTRFGKKLQSEDYIHEAEKDSSKEVKKKTVDVMKGKNKVEVNPKIQAESKKMTKCQIKKRDEIADAISSKEMNKRYGDENVKYAIATKLAMKNEAKEEGGYISNLSKAQVRNQRRFGKKGSTEPQGFFGQKPSEAAELNKKRTDEHKARRGVKNESVSGIEVQNVSDGIKFREYEFIDVVKPEPMKSPKNNITWTEEVGSDGEGLTPSQQRKGLGMSGSGIRKLKKDMEKKGNFNVKKNLAKNTPDEQHTTTTSEAKAPVGLMKLAATVAANNKKRKNALQIQKYIGEQTKEVDKKKLNKSLELTKKITNYGSAEPFLSDDELKKRTEAKRKKRERIAKGDDRTTKKYNKDKLETSYQKTKLNQIFKTEETISERRGQSKSAYGRNPYDNITSSVKKITRTGIGPGIEHYSDDEKKKSEKEKIKDAKDPKKNMSRERATQNMQMIKRMTPEQKYARKMRIKQQNNKPKK